jgi:hypothetical protein
MKWKYKKDKRFDQLIYFIFINLHTIQYIIYILLLTYYRISNTDTINEFQLAVMQPPLARGHVLMELPLLRNSHLFLEDMFKMTSSEDM